MTKAVHTENLILRPITANEVGSQYCAWLNDPKVIRYLRSAPHSAAKRDRYSNVRRPLQQEP